MIHATYHVQYSIMYITCSIHNTSVLLLLGLRDQGCHVLVELAPNNGGNGRNQAQASEPPHRYEEVYADLGYR